MVSPTKEIDFTFLTVTKGKLIATETTKLSVLSYNILASMYCNKTHFPTSDPDTLNSKKRLQKIVR